LAEKNKWDESALRARLVRFWTLALKKCVALAIQAQSGPR
jgi:hypothetical protein